MKICIIGNPRSRSTYLRDTISAHYNIPVISESEFDQSFGILPVKCYNGTDWDPYIDPELKLKFLQAFEQLQKSFLERSNFVIKIHPSKLTMSPASGTIINFDLYNFKQYDDIYFSTRTNIVDSICSYFIADKTDKWHYGKDETPLEIVKQPMTSKIAVMIFIWHELINNELKKYLSSNNISWKEIDYTDMPSYLNEHFPGDFSNTLDTQYDYKLTISNYDEILEMYNSMKSSVQELFYKHNPELNNV